MIPAIVSGGRSSADPIAASILSKLTSWWEMNEVSGNRLDSIGTNHLSIFGTVNTASGVRGSDIAAAFSGSGGLTVPSNSGLSVPISGGAYCSFGWGYINTNSGVQFLASKYDDSNSGGVTLEHAISLQSPNMYASNGNSGGSGSSSASQSPPSAGSWHFYVMWLDPSDGKVRLSIDNASPTVSANATVANPGSGGPLRFGYTGPSNTNKISGRLQRWGWIKGSIPTAAERAYLYNSGQGRTYPELLAA